MKKTISIIICIASLHCIASNKVLPSKCAPMFEKLELKSEQGSAAEKLKLATVLIFGYPGCIERDEIKAVEVLLPLVSVRNAKSLELMGYIYKDDFYGDGLVDIKKAKQYFKDSVELGNIKAKRGYAEVLSKSAATIEELEESLSVYESLNLKSRKPLNATIKDLKKRLYIEKGKAENSLENALGWLDKVKELGDENYHYHRANMLTKYGNYSEAIDDYEVFITDDYKKRLKNYFSERRIKFLKAMNNNISEKLGRYESFKNKGMYYYELARAYQFGYGEYKIDITKARDNYRKSSDLDYSTAQLELGLLLLHEGDSNNAMKYLRLASGNGDKLAMYQLFLAFSNGSSPTIDNLEEALNVIKPLVDSIYRKTKSGVYLGKTNG